MLLTFWFMKRYRICYPASRQTLTVALPEPISVLLFGYADIDNLLRTGEGRHYVFGWLRYRQVYNPYSLPAGL